MKARKAANEGLGVALLLLRLTSAAADAFPPLKIAAGGALFILDTATKFSSNKQQWEDLATYVATAIACVIESLPKSKEPREDLRLRIEKLAECVESSIHVLTHAHWDESTLHHIQKEIRSIQQQSGFTRALAFAKDPDKILGMRKELDDALVLFHLNAALTTGLDIAKILDGVNMEALLERVNTKLSDVIVSTINLNAIPCAEGASWDPNPNNACLPNTRVELLEEIMAWVESSDHEGAPRILWLNSVAGGGKTAIANTVAKRCHEKGLLAASFFFDRKTAGRNEPKRLFSALARGLANYSREIAVEINRAIEDDQSVATSPIFRQFEELIRLPSVHYSGRKAITIVMDGLDEGVTTELLQILRDEFPKLPSVFRIFVTSRPEPQIVSFLANKPHIRRVAINIQGQSNVDDICLYAERELREVAIQRSLPMDWPGAELLQEFVAKAAGLFIWVAVISRYLCRISYPEKKLAGLLSKRDNKTLTAEAQMDAIYSSILESCDWEDEDFLEGYHLVMGAIIALRTPLSIHALQSLHRSSPIRVEEILRPISSLIASDLSELTQPVQILHLCLQEFLTSRSQNSPLFAKFYLGSKEHSRRLAYLCLTILNADLRLDIPGTGFLQEDTPESKLPGIPVLNAADIPEVLWYACRFWIDHLMDVEAPDGRLILELQTFLTLRLASWLEILTGRGQFQTLERLWEWSNKAEYNRSDGPVDKSKRVTSTLFYDVSDRLTYMDRREDALSAIEQAVALRRHLATDRPALGQSLISLSNRLFSLGRREDALTAIQEAVELYGQLAADNPASFHPDLALSLNNLSIYLSSLGREEDALHAIETAVVLRRGLAADRPAIFNSDLAFSLCSLSICLSQTGRREDALEAIDQSVALRHQHLTPDCPAPLDSDFAQSLNILSLSLSDLGRRDDALNAIEKAVEVYRQLAADRPATFKADLAQSLSNLSLCLTDLGRREDALSTIQEAVELYRQLAPDRPARFQPDLALSLNNLSVCLSDLGRQEDALAAVEEAVALRRELAAGRPATFNPDLAQSLNNLSNCLSNLGRREDSLDAIEQSVALRRQLSADRPAAFNPEFAQSLSNLSLRLSDLGRREDALDAINHAVALYRPLACDSPGAFNPNLAMSLLNRSLHLSKLGRQEDALAAVQEVVELYRQLAADHPASFNPDLALSLNNLSNRLADLGHKEDALTAIETAVALRRELAADRPAAFNADLAQSLNNLSNRLSDLGRTEYALDAIESAVALRRELAAIRPAAANPDLAQSLYNLSLRLYDLDRREDALKAVEQVIALYRQLAEERPKIYNTDLVGCLMWLYECLSALGRDEEAEKAKKEAESLTS